VAFDSYELLFATRKANAKIYFDVSFDALFLGVGNFSPSNEKPTRTRLPSTLTYTQGTFLVHTPRSREALFYQRQLFFAATSLPRTNSFFESTLLPQKAGVSEPARLPAMRLSTKLFSQLKKFIPSPKTSSSGKNAPLQRNNPFAKTLADVQRRIYMTYYVCISFRFGFSWFSLVLPWLFLY
jgi:hypothetical protein